MAEQVKKKSKKIKRKIFTGLALLVIFVGLGFFLFSGSNVEVVKELFKDDVTKEEVQETLSSLGMRGYIAIGILAMLQVTLTFIPAEPVQVIAGISFGFWKGGLLCLTGVLVGNTVLYIAYKIYGQRLTEYFKCNAEFDFEYARKSKRIALVIFILYFLPAIPYGLICIFSASLNIKYPKYILLTGLGSIPSIMIGVGLGHLAIAASWTISIIVFAVLIILLAVLVKNKSKVFARVNEFMKKQNGPQKPSRVLYAILLFCSRLIFTRKVKVQMKNNVGRLERPSLVLCNHGSFIDFAYMGRMLKKERTYICSARLYFYHKTLGRLIMKLGAIPKSMFAADIENAKNCVRVLSEGEVLTMMPEARLSTIGKFEGIQDATYKFIQKSNVPVYTLHFNGDYFANPKWGDGVRKGSVVECELNPLFKADEVREISLDELKRRVEKALDYDEFAWLKTRPEISYKSKAMAKGLENIVCICPKCGAKSSYTSEKDTITCEKCGLSAKINNRYGFENEQPFENFAVWYEWQTARLKEEIENNPSYYLESKVELRHSSIDGKHLTRHAGEGVCRLDRTGLIYKGSRDGETVEKFFPMEQIYRLLFGAGEDFEIYEGKEIWYFVPENKRSCVTWYIVSGILKEAEIREVNKK